MVDRTGVFVICVTIGMAISFAVGLYQEVEVRNANQYACEQAGLIKSVEVQPLESRIWFTIDTPRYVKCSGFTTVDNHIEVIEQWVFINGSKP